MSKVLEANVNALEGFNMVNLGLRTAGGMKVRGDRDNQPYHVTQSRHYSSRLATVVV